MDYDEQFSTRLDRLCRKYSVPHAMVEEMLSLEKKKASHQRRDNIFVDLEDILSKFTDQTQERLP